MNKLYFLHAVQINEYSNFLDETVSLDTERDLT